jgi:hypothetical protein
MFKFVNLAVFTFFLNINLFSMEIDISWNEKIYKHNTYGFSVSDYKSVSEIDYGKTVVVIAKWDEYINFDEIIFRLYYDNNICIFQKSIFGWSRFGYDKVSVECEITAAKEYLEQMQVNDTLYYKCSFEFPSGEIIESEPIKAAFSFSMSTTIPNMESIEYFDYSYLLKSDDGEYYKILNFKGNGFIQPDNPWYYRSDGNIFLFLKFENLLPGKIYSLTGVKNTVSTLFDGQLFYVLPLL